MTVDTLRPGVFSEYTLSTLYTAGSNPRYAALLCRATDQASTPQWVESYGQAAALFATDATGLMLPALATLFASGVARVCCVALPADAVAEDYAVALDSITEQKNIYAIVCDAQTPDELTAVKTAVTARSTAQRECIAFCGCELPATAATLATELNCERMVLTCPAALPTAGSSSAHPLFGACAVAGAVLGVTDPAASLSGCALTVLPGLDSPLTDPQVELLLGSGVTPLEETGSQTEAVRILTTRTSTDGVADRSFAPINTTLILDDVLTAVRNTLKLQLQGAKNTPQGYDSISSQVTVLLAAKQDAGIITSYSSPRVAADSSDPTICVVELSFGVAYAVNQIHILAHVLV